MEPPELTLPDLPEEEETEEPDQQETRSPRPRRRHRARARQSSTSSSDRPSPKPQSNLADRFAPAWEKEIRKGYTEALVLVGGVSMLALPVTGRVMVGRAPYTADVLVRLARTDERIRAALLAVLRYSVVLELVTVVGSLGLAVAVDRAQGEQKLRLANNPAVNLLIGAEVQDALQSEQQRATASNGQQQPAAPWAGSPAQPVSPEG
jgi:hypothetical protein